MKFRRAITAANGNFIHICRYCQDGCRCRRITRCRPLIKKGPAACAAGPICYYLFLRMRSCFNDLGRHIRIFRCKIVDKHLRQLIRLCIISCLVCPHASCIEEFIRYIRAMLRIIYIEDIVMNKFNIIERNCNKYKSKYRKL